MKQGINFLLPIEIGTDLDLVEKIEFILKQNDFVMTYEYPSSSTIREGNSVSLKFTEDDTWKFKAEEPIYIDTRITLIGSPYQPETKIVAVKMNRTLFKKED